MPAKMTRAIDRLTSGKAVALLAPAILLLGATIAAGQNAGEAVRVAQAAKVEASPGASAFTPAQRKEIEAIVKELLMSNPELLMEVQSALEAKMEKLQNERMAAAIKDNSAEIFRPASSPIVGNANGDVTVIEFFDYNCGYCKRALPDIARLIDKDKKVKFIPKEFPILAKGSEEASRVALAAKMQGKYWEVHRGLLESQGPANEASALRIAEKLGLDMARLKKDMASPEVKKEIDDTRKLASKLGIQGTPHFLVGDRIIAGAPENLTELLSQSVNEVRKDGCKVC